MTKIPLPTAYDFDIQYHTDGTKLYYARCEIKDVDLASFELYVGWFGKDKNRCYRRGTVFAEADLETFEVLNWAFAKDKNMSTMATKKSAIPGPIGFGILTK